MKKRYMILGCVAAVAIASASIGGAWSYFTTYTEVKGTRTVSLGDKTDIHEEVSDGEKRVSISITEDSQPVYVRVKAFASGDYQKMLVYEPAERGAWTTAPDGDGYVYYTSALRAEDQETSQLLVRIPEVLIEGNEDFNIVVVYESVPVQLGADGEPLPYNDAKLWSQEVNTGTGGEGK